MNRHKGGDLEPASGIFCTSGKRASRGALVLSTRGHDTTRVLFDPCVLPEPPATRNKKNKDSLVQRVQSESALKKKKSSRILRDEAHSKVIFHIQTPLLLRGEEMMKQHELVIPENETLDSYSQRLALEIESFVYAAFGGDDGKLTAEYSAKVRTITFNLDKNPLLSAEMLYNGISPERLSTMTSEEMAGKELKTFMEKVRIQSDINITLTKNTGPRIRKNHKGEELVENVRQNSIPREDDSLFKSGVFPTATTKQSTMEIRRSFSLSNVLDRISPRPEATPPSTRARNVRKNIVFQVAEDSDSDLLMYGIDDEFSISLPPPVVPEQDKYSPVQFQYQNETQLVHLGSELHQDENLGWDVYDPRIQTSPIEWMGRVEMYGITSICATARHIGGPEYAAQLKWPELLEGILQIDSNVDSRTAGNYFRSLRSSSTNKVIVVSLSPTDRHDVSEIQKLYDYYKLTTAYAIVSKHTLRCIRGVYIFFLDNQNPVPFWFSSLNPRPTIPASGRSARLLIVTLVVVDNNDHLLCNDDTSAEQASACQYKQGVSWGAPPGVN